MRSTISCVMIVLNEEHNVRKALESVRWMDQIIVVDAYSQDETVAICKEYTSEVLLRKWTGAPDQRNYAIQHATGDWVFNIDADEQVTPTLREELEAVLTSPIPPAYAGYYIPRKNFYYWKMGSRGWMVP